MDTSKHIFQLHGVNVAEAPVLRKKRRRKEMVTFFEKLAPTVIGIEACSASNHWARLLQLFGHTVNWDYGVMLVDVGDDNDKSAKNQVTGIPGNIFWYVLEASGGHQLSLVILTTVVFLLEIVPLELQRRIINDLVKNREYWFIGVLCGVYAGTVLIQGSTKLVRNIYRSWISERATRDLRRKVHRLVSSNSVASSTLEAEGVQASMIVSEVEAIGGFVGGSLSEPLLQAGILCSVPAYMIHVDQWMAGTAFLLFLPQLVFVPLMQGAMNKHVRERVQIIRQLSVSVTEGQKHDAARDRTDDWRIQHVFELNMGFFV